MQLAYLGFILFSFFGMGVLDRKYKLAFFNDARKTILIVLIGVLIFLIWDLFGVGLGIFFYGGSEITTGLMVLPEVPIEEIFFLSFLCYFSLVSYRLLEEKLA